jgi:hypothetical protein
VAAASAMLSMIETRMSLTRWAAPSRAAGAQV